MKSIKSILSLVLVFSVLLSSVSTVFAGKYLDSYEFIDDIFKYDVGDFVKGDDAVADETDETGRTIAFLDTLGIINKDDFAKRDALISMTEFSVIMSRVRLGVNNALENVYPIEPNVDKTNATYYDAYSYLIDALGYKYKCNQYNNPQQAVIIVAAEIGLIKENPETLDTFITREDLALLIKKALEIDVCTIEYNDYGYSYEVVEGKNLLNTMHNLHNVSGFVNAIEGLSVYGGVNTRKGFIQIDRKNMRFSGFNDADYFGRVVNAYATYDEAKNEYTIVSIEYEEEATPFVIDFKDINSIVDGDIYYNDADGNEQIYSVSTVDKIVQNGEMLSSFDKMCDYKNSEGKIVLTPSSKYGDVDTAIIWKYNYFMTSYNDTREMRIGLKFKQTYNGNGYIQLSDKANIKVKIAGAVSDWQMIKAGSAIRVMQCISTGYTELVVNSAAISGEVMGMSDDYITVSETEMRISKDLLAHIEECKTNPAISGSDNVKYPEIGLNGAFYVIDGVLAGYVTESAYMYGYLRTATLGRSSIDPELSLRIFGQDGKWYDATIGAKLELDGVSGVEKDRVIKIIKDNPSILGSVVRMKLSSDNKLLALDTIMESDVEMTTDDDIKFTRNYTGLAQWTSEWLNNKDTSENYKYSMTADTVLFYVPDEYKDDEEEIAIMKNSQLNNSWGEPDWTMQIYNCNDFNQIELGLVTDHPDASSGGGGATFYVESISQAIIDKEEMIYGYRITGKQLQPSMAVGSSTIKEAKYYIEADVLNKNVVEASSPAYDPNLHMEIGDLVDIEIKSGKVEKWSMELKSGVVDPANLGFETDGATYNGGDSARHYFYGIVEKVDTEKDYALINVGGHQITPKIRCKLYVDPVTDKMTNLRMDDIHEGDVVFGYWSYGICSYVIKN